MVAVGTCLALPCICFQPREVLGSHRAGRAAWSSCRRNPEDLEQRAAPCVVASSPGSGERGQPLRSRGSKQSQMARRLLKDFIGETYRGGCPWRDRRTLSSISQGGRSPQGPLLRSI